jgi:hypothetical protein
VSRSLTVFALVIVALGFASSSLPAQAAANRVCPGAGPGCGFTSIQAAIDAAQAGQTITIAKGTYHEHLTVSVTTATPLQLVGEGNSSVIVDAGQQGSALTVANGHTVTITGMTFTNGHAPAGGGIANEGGTVTLTNSLITGNTAFGPNGRGGGIDNGGTMTLTNTPVSANTGSRAGGVFNGSLTGTASIQLTHSPISGNHASNGTGGMSNAGTATLTNSPISDNIGGLVGGLGNGSGEATLTHSPVTGNQATATSIPAGGFGIAGGIGNANVAVVHLVNSAVSNNTAPSGSNSAGGINDEPPGVVTFQHSSVQNNTPPQCLPLSLC